VNIHDAAQAEGATLYGDPENPPLAEIDPLIRPIVARLTESGWVWAAESCQGHPDAPTGHYVWAKNTRAMLRLLCRREHRGPMLDLLAEALAEQFAADDFTVGCELHSWKRMEHWAEVLVYLGGTTARERDRALAAWARFAELTLAYVPAPNERGAR
jgi:hypothetical protein